MAGQDAKEEARSKIADLVDKFASNKADYLGTAYNETQARTEFISPLLQALGWDVNNIKGQPLGLREVIEEATVEVGEEGPAKKPDYELRLARQRKLFIEAKKPSVRIATDKPSAFQTRRYGYSAGLPVSILTNFHQLAVYDCLLVPDEANEAHVSRLKLMRYDQLLDNFDYLWDTLSRDAVYSGEFDRKFAADIKRRGTEQFDHVFLRQVQDWRKRLAEDIYTSSSEVTAEELTYAVQLFLCRIVFLRICEDRDIEKYEMLKGLDSGDTFNDLMRELKRADAFYDSGVFSLLNDESLGIRISDGTLRSIISELYYPQSPYTFSVIETEVLGRIYEQFLSEVIDISEDKIEIVEKPEIREGGGVVPTPQYIVNSIVDRALAPALSGKTPSDLKNFAVADICCGSGPFLLSAYGKLLEHYMSSYMADLASNAGKTVYEAAGGQWRLTFREKRRILLDHIRGVDVDPNAADVAQFSLLLKLIEGETKESLSEYVDSYREPALPPLCRIVCSGNSLVSYTDWKAAMGCMPPSLASKVNPLDWASEFSDEVKRGGFDVIVGNPPYVRIQHMVKYSPEEVCFFQDNKSPYSTARLGNFDKYALFVERALDLLCPRGRLGFIVPHKFMTISSGRTLRRLISDSRSLEEVVYFGTEQVFPETSNYTCILVFDKRGREHVEFERPGPLKRWRYDQVGLNAQIPADDLAEEPWQFLTEETRALFERVKQSFPDRLGKLADIFVGAQTSADHVYIFTPTAEDEKTSTLTWNDKDWPIERGILRPSLYKPRSNFQAYARPMANTRIIFPYEMVPARGGLRARLIQPDEMSTRFPACWEYLNARRTELEHRNVNGGPKEERQWYQFGRSQSLTKFRGPKIILTVLSKGPPCAYDDADMMVTGGGNGPYYAIRSRPDASVSDYYLLAVLNHPLIGAMVRAATSTFRGDYPSYGKQFVDILPVPVPSKPKLNSIEESVIELIDTLGRIRASRTPSERTIVERRAANLRNVIENSVSTLFGLGVEEMNVVRGALHAHQSNTPSDY